MTSLLRGVFVVGGKRTAFGSFGGKLKDTSIVELAEIASKAAIASANVTPDMIDSVTVGCVNQSSSVDGAYVARHTALRAGCPIHIPCLTVNRLCGSGFQSVITAAQDICLRESEIALAADTENMSQSPFVIRFDIILYLFKIIQNDIIHSFFGSYIVEMLALVLNFLRLLTWNVAYGLL